MRYRLERGGGMMQFGFFLGVSINNFLADGMVL